MSRSAADVEDGKWEIAESKSFRKNKKRKTRHDDDGAPSLSFLDTKPAVVQVKALQELVLYVLAGGVAPTWLAVKNARKIKRVVMLMVPGMDREMMDSDILKHLETDREVDKEPIRAANGTDTSSSKPLGDASTNPAAVTMSPEGRESTPETKIEQVPLLLQHIIPVRGPGDSRACKVHSPLQAMLIVPDSAEKGTNNTQKSFQADRSPITTFIHTAEELVEAQYPVHPAHFTDPLEASTERTRREKASQSNAHGWVDSSVSDSSPAIPHALSTKSQDSTTRGLTIYSLDCEMVLTSDNAYSLARISLISWSGSVVLDEYVKPSLPITNYFTQFSGITPSHLENVTTSLTEVQTKLLSLLTQSTVLLGHSLESDLAALKITHPFIVDTSMIYPHPRGLPLRSSLKFLANRYLKREIQKGGASGHDSVEDARAVLDLVKMKCEKGPKWGTNEANGESLFRKINRAKRGDGTNRTTAMVEYGTPEKGLGKDASVAIGCESDDDVVKGVLKAVHGDSADAAPAEASKIDQKNGSKHEKAQHIPFAGVDFVWARLRALECIRGWNNPPVSPNPTSSTTVLPSTTPDTSTTIDPTPDSTTLHQTTISTLQNITHTWRHLPPSTLMILYTGTSDMRPFLALQNLHAQFKREFRVKKWDELSVRWTDTEQQALGRAAEEARRGWGVLAIR